MPHPGEKALKEIQSFEIRKQKRVRIHEERESKVGEKDRAFYYSQNTIEGTEKVKRKQREKKDFQRLMKKLTKTFELDEVLEEDEHLRKKI